MSISPRPNTRHSTLTPFTLVEDDDSWGDWIDRHQVLILLALVCVSWGIVVGLGYALCLLVVGLGQ